MKNRSGIVLMKINTWTLYDDACLCGGGVEASWTLMFSIDIVRPTYSDFDMPGVIILGYISNGDLLLLIKIGGYVWISRNADGNANEKEAKIVPLSVDVANYYYTSQVYNLEKDNYIIASSALQKEEMCLIMYLLKVAKGKMKNT
ncbi:hypothetical protein POM88_054947 [Heracleum sosnowskyi]|uniref:Uncharacterized protein n=1 Tax=Heracleum sosnowskyi TaxID=360622 RepID=A0AAD8LWC2_9APIA|nr:hypothetical protein POM88_054947 [Heracleum sosnowskyi]